VWDVRGGRQEAGRAKDGRSSKGCRVRVRREYVWMRESEVEREPGA
jgi:hypothetical protein